jgi:endonuclease/exonuclease/phosphatase family metal-dependent hydrolase
VRWHLQLATARWLARRYGRRPGTRTAGTGGRRRNAPPSSGRSASTCSAHRSSTRPSKELNQALYTALLAALGDQWWGVFSLAAREGLRPPSRFWGVAVYGRFGAVTRIGAADVIGDSEDESGAAGLFWRRTVAVPVMTHDGQALTVASVHVRPGAVVGDQKLQFLARLASWLRHGPRPLVLGVDANSPGVADDGSEHYWGIERDMWGPAATHGLHDTWRSMAKPFSPTHRLRSGKGVRFDHLWVSPELQATSHQHVLDDALSVGSDHALVIADLLLPEEGSPVT